MPPIAPGLFRFCGLTLIACLLAAMPAGDLVAQTSPARGRSAYRMSRGRSLPLRPVSSTRSTAARWVSHGFNRCNACEQCNLRFWIVSSRRCRLDKNGPCCRLDHFRYESGRCVAQSDPAAFHRWLIPGAPVCVVVHGSFTSFRDLLAESRALCLWLHAAAPQRPLNVVIFSWPGDDYPTGFFPIDVTVLGRRSARHGVYLARFLEALPTGSRVCLIGHSHGSRTVAAAMHLRGGGTVQGYRLCRTQPCRNRFRVVLLAAAIDHHWLDPRERYGCALVGTECLLNLRNRADLPLRFYPLRKPFGHRSLARAGFTKRDRRRLGGWNPKVAEMDVTPLIGEQHLWHYYFRQTGISAAIAPYVHFNDDDRRLPPARSGPQLPSQTGHRAAAPPTAVRRTSHRRPV